MYPLKCFYLQCKKEVYKRGLMDEWIGGWMAEGGLLKQPFLCFHEMFELFKMIDFVKKLVTSTLYCLCSVDDTFIACKCIKLYIN